MKANLAKAGAGKVVCRLCKGAHFTAKCPYKDSLAGLDGAGTSLGLSFCDVFNSVLAMDVPDDDDAPTPAQAAAAPSGPSKYVPPSMRGGVRGPGESMNRSMGSRDDLPTLRVTNISEDVQEQDLRDLFGAFGRVARAYVGRDRETGAGKGFAFISYEDRAHAQRAMEKMHGRGYDNLILNVQWSRMFMRSTMC
jgi:translation initiation factor 3 subunit G